MDDFEEEKQQSTILCSQNQNEQELKVQDKDYENQMTGFESLIKMTKKSTNVSFIYSKLGSSFLRHVQESGIKLGSQFIYSANCSELWQCLRVKLKKFNKLFQEDDYMIIQRILLIAKLQIQYFLTKQCSKQLGKQHKLVNRIEQILKLHRNRPINFSNADFKCSKFYIQYVQKQIIFQSPPQKNYRMKIYQAMSKLQINVIEDNNSLISTLLNQTLSCIYQTIRSSNMSNTKSAFIIYLIICYLKIRLSSKKWLYVLVSSSNVNSLYMTLLSQSNGINKIIRYFQDATEQSLRKQYQFTKQCMNNR